MHFNLTKDLVFFDLETTGLSVVRDRILQIGLIKYPKSGTPPIEKSMLINPGIPISEEAFSVHGIGPKDVANKPTFAQIAVELYEFIGDADLGGYNSNRFDIPMLIEEFYRAGLDFDISKRRLIDVQRIFYKMEPRTLGAAYRFYCGEVLDNAHDALEDVRATVAVLKGQLARYAGEDLIDGNNEVIREPIKNDIQVLHDFVNDLNTLDATQKLKMAADGTPVFNFGKYQNKPVGETLHKDKQYYQWIMNKEFSAQTKQMVKQIVLDYEKNIK